MESYIVRIYRRDRKKPHLVAGVVEEVGNTEKRGFENIDELKSILTRESFFKDNSAKENTEDRGDF